MSRAGRKRKALAIRSPSGRIAYGNRTETERDITGTVARQPHRVNAVAEILRVFPRSKISTKHELLGCALGRLQLAGLISEAQRDTGLAWAASVDRYHRLTGLASEPDRSALAPMIYGGGAVLSADPDPEAVRIARTEYSSGHDVLAEVGRRIAMDTSGSMDRRCALMVCRKVCVRDDDPIRDPDDTEIGILRTALNELHRVMRY